MDYFLLGSKDFKEKLRERDTQLTIALLVVLGLGFGGYKIYKWHTNKIQGKAQRAFSESMDLYGQAVMAEMNDKKAATEKTKLNLWDEVEISFRTGYEDNKKSTLAPFFLAFESNAQEKLNKDDESYKNLSEAVQMLPKNSPYYYLYSTKQALMEIDKDTQKGVEHLNNLVKDSSNILKDMAAFYLGEYYWSINNIDKAKEQYQIALGYNPESTWGTLAKMRLERLG